MSLLHIADQPFRLPDGSYGYDLTLENALAVDSATVTNNASVGGVLTADSAVITNDISVGRTANLHTTVLDMSDDTAITAAGGITVTNPIMHVHGDGGPVTVTANPQISAGVNGQLLVVYGASDTNTVALQDGNGIHLHGAAILKDHDALFFVYDDEESRWSEVSRNFQASEKSWSFSSPLGVSGTFYYGGFYQFGATHNDFSPAITFGTANAAKAAHFLVVLGETAVDEISITVTGTSITDDGVRTTSDSEVITIPNASVANTYFETAKKWLGQIGVETTAGTPKNCNYGFAKYWDSNNSKFTIRGVEVTWVGGANDTAPDIRLYHHKATGWTYNAGAKPTPPTPVASMATDHGTEKQVINSESGAWKRANLLETIDGAGSEGTIFAVVTSANRTFESGNIMMRITPG